MVGRWAEAVALLMLELVIQWEGNSLYYDNLSAAKPFVLHSLFSAALVTCHHSRDIELINIGPAPHYYFHITHREGMHVLRQY